MEYTFPFIAMKFYYGESISMSMAYTGISINDSY
jgi:hypothetical protein